MKYLESTIEVPVRFSETDAMGVVWHGNYLKFFEDAREFFGKEHGLEYLDCYNNGFFTPIVKSDINHKAPIYYGERVKITAKLLKKHAAKIQFEYTVVNESTGAIAATGGTTQVFLYADSRTLELNKPDFYAEWEDKLEWKTDE